jgi:hypothetical protein
LGYLADYINPYNTAAGPVQSYFRISLHSVDHNGNADVRVAVYTDQTAADNGDQPLAEFNPYVNISSPLDPVKDILQPIKIDYESGDNEKTQIYNQILALPKYSTAISVKEPGVKILKEIKL